MLRALLVAITFATLSTIAANAQSSEHRDAQVRVQLALNFFVPGSTTDGDETRMRQARRTLYEVAGRECELLRETMAKDCRLESVNIQVNRQHGQQHGQQVEGYLANGNFTMQVTLK